MKKLVLSSIVAGTAYFVFIVIFSLLSMVMDVRLVSIAFGGMTIILLDLVFGILQQSCDFKMFSRKFYISFAIVVGVAMTFVTLLWFSWEFYRESPSLLVGWIVAGWLLFIVAKNIGRVLQKRGDTNSNKSK